MVKDDISQAWRDSSNELAEWAERLINRDDGCGKYLPPKRRKGKQNAYTLKRRATKVMLKRHFVGEDQGHLLGLHTTSPDNTCRWAAIDIDNHKDEPGDNVARNEHAAVTWFLRLRSIGFNPLLLDSNGAGGYHLIIVFSEPRDSIEAFGLVRWVMQDWKDQSFVRPPETFPKQPMLSDRKVFGNWLRLPGRHHTREHWTRVYNGTQWTEGSDAISIILQADGDSESSPQEAFDLGEQVASARRTAEQCGFDGVVGELSDATNEFLVGKVAEGERNSRLYRAACDYNGCGYGLSEAKEQLLKACIACGLSVAESEYTIEGAFKAPKMPETIQWTQAVGHAIKARSKPQSMIGSVSRETKRAIVRPASDDATGAGQPKATVTAPVGPYIEPDEIKAHRRPSISNVIEGKGREGEPRTYVRAAIEVLRELQESADGWPCRVSGLPFSVEPVETADENDPSPWSIKRFCNPNQLFAWMHFRLSVHWYSRNANEPIKQEARTPITKAEFFEFASQFAAPSYSAIERLPHQPELEDHYYTPYKLPSPNGKALHAIAERFNSETDLDRQLMMAALVTPCWGGLPGTRPAFMFDSDHGLGVGKSETARCIASVWGGVIEFGQRDNPEQIRTRLLSDESLDMRCVLLDNIKGKLGGSWLESVITADKIQGHRMYHGQFSRPNTLTWLFTFNAPSMTRDLADRTVVIKVGPPQHDTDFIAWYRKFTKDNRPQLIADVVSFLKQKPQCKIEKHDRWSSWQDSVLTRFENGNELAELLRERRAPIDTDREDAESIYGMIVAELYDRGHRPNDQVVEWTNGQMREILVQLQILERGTTTTKATRYMKIVTQNEPLRSCLQMRRTMKGAVWTWAKENSFAAPVKLMGRPQHYDEHEQREFR